MEKGKLLKFVGSANFRQRIVLATLSGRAIRIDDIRTEDESPGLRDFEASFLRLIDKLTNGTMIKINETGTSLKFKPGLIVGNSVEEVVHECALSRCSGYQ